MILGLVLKNAITTGHEQKVEDALQQQVQVLQGIKEEVPRLRSELEGLREDLQEFRKDMRESTKRPSQTTSASTPPPKPMAAAETFIPPNRPSPKMQCYCRRRCRCSG